MSNTELNGLLEKVSRRDEIYSRLFDVVRNGNVEQEAALKDELKVIERELSVIKDQVKS